MLLEDHGPDVVGDFGESPLAWAAFWEDWFHTFSVSDLRYLFRSFGSTDRMYWIARQALTLAVCSHCSFSIGDNGLS